MITRYYRFMQLKASHPPNLLLIPTLDIELVWQTHLLRPKMYKVDCLRLFGRVIDRSLLMTEVEQFFKEQALRDTCQLYEQHFGEQYCPLPPTDGKQGFISNISFQNYMRKSMGIYRYSYWDDTYFEFSSQSPKDYENPFSFTEADIIIDIQWLDMCQQFIIWHSHMQEPLKYAADCIRIVGYVIDHAPWSMIEDDVTKKTREQMEDIWKEEFEINIMTDHLYNTAHRGADWYDDY
ncbi:unnamed protein product [Rotaria sordida]|nr:unnamed protein product [Rotaria sordida]